MAPDAPGGQERCDVFEARLRAVDRHGDRYFAERDPKDLARWTDAARQALENARGPVQEGRAAYRLAWALSVAHSTDARLGLLQEADELLRSAALPRDHAERPPMMGVATTVFLGLFQSGGDVEYLASAIETARDGIDGAAPDDPRLPNWSANLANCLRVYAELTGEAAVLDEAVVRGRSAAEAWRYSQPMVLAGLASSLYYRFAVRHRAEDLAEAMKVAHRAYELAPLDPTVLGVLSATLRLEFERTGSVDHLTEALTMQRRLVQGLSTGFPERAIHLANLAELLRLRGERLGSMGDLDEAIELAIEAAETAPGRDERAALIMLTQTLTVRAAAHVAGAPEQARADALAAIAAADRVLELIPEGHEATANFLTLRANAWWVSHRAGEPGAIERAIATYEQAALVPAPPLQRGLMLSNLGVLLSREGTGDPPALDRAIEVMEKARTLIPVDHPVYAQNTANLAAGCYRRSLASTSASDLARAGALADDGSASEAAPPSQRVVLSALSALFAVERGDLVAAARSFRSALNQYSFLAWQGGDRQAVAGQLARVEQLGSDAAACMIALGDEEGALEAVEHGRGVLWAQLLQLRSQHADTSPTARRLAEIAAALDTGVRTRDERMTLMDEWRRLQVQAAADRDANIVTRPRAAELKAAAINGPVVVVNVSAHRSDALIVEPDRVRAQDLPGLTPDLVRDHVTHNLETERDVEAARRRAFDAQARYEQGDQGFSGTRRAHQAWAALRTAERVAVDVLDRTLAWLWDVVAGPVLTALGPPGAEPLRLWWCPTGLLALLPLHAAGHDSGQSLLDLTVGSYTPTVRALAESQKAGPSNGDRLLIVSLAASEGQLPLPEVEEERQRIQETIGPDRTAVLEGANATRAAVREGLRTHSWAHVSCHGLQSLEDPFQGGLVLHDGMLTVEDVRAGHHRGEFLALLACDTARGGLDLADEAVTLSSAFHYTGYRHVVGTLWSVRSGAAAEFSASLYRHLVTGGRFAPERSAYAVRAAALELRERQRLSWVPFTHTGP
ncbi:CHAT domain-containing protein [Actinomadura sp. NPDC023710]|uniref:CHAT domain-containing protein n=1 Tax=Actinomadura sp. NPDC023710 TaxID=3158219 RepID=UPI0033CE7102